MLSIEEVERTILELEKRDTTYATCERLAWLYIVHDHLTQRIVQEKARAADMEGSPFLAACSGAEIAEILRIIRLGNSGIGFRIEIHIVDTVDNSP